jgi:two-component system, cell cycle sensor histidine kinase and response regulator CckA
MAAALEVQTGPSRNVNAELVNAAFEGSPEGLAIIENGRILHANAALARLLGYDEPSRLAGVSLSALRPTRHSCIRANGSDTARTADGHPLCEFTTRRTDGSTVVLEATCSAVRYAERDLLIMTARDISLRERRRGTRDSERRFRAIFDAAAIGIVQCAEDGRVLESNPAGEALLGFSRSELRGRRLWEFTRPENPGEDQRLFQEMIESKRPGYQLEMRYAGGESKAGWMRFTASLVKGVSGQFEFALGMMEDITERKRAEEQLREAQKMEAIGRLVGGVAHDFNNLLTGIMLYCDLLIAGLGAESRAHHHAGEIRMAAEQGAALIQQLLAIVRQQVVEPRLLCLNEIVAKTRNLLSRLIGDGIQFEAILADDLGYVKMDPAQVQQILFNLVLNARDAMPEGGCITVKTADSILVPSGDAIPNAQLPAVLLSVSDTGSGMSAETRAHLFEPFFTTKKPGRGNGLGLATVYNIVRNNRGTIEVDSELGRGTTVRVLLPRAMETQMPCLEQGAYSPSKGGETVLLVEDNVTVRKAAHRILSECGYNVLEASSGADALALSEQHQGAIHLLLADVVMPGMSGREVARQLRARMPGLKTLYMSGYEPPERGTDEELVVFHKPFTGAVLLGKVREILDTSQSNGGEKRS